MAPMTAASRAQASMAVNNATGTDTEAFCSIRANTYAPLPKNMACPKDTMPPYPTSMFKEVASKPMAHKRMMKSTTTREGEVNGKANKSSKASKAHRLSFCQSRKWFTIAPCP